MSELRMRVPDELRGRDGEQLPVTAYGRRLGVGVVDGDELIISVDDEQLLHELGLDGS